MTSEDSTASSARRRRNLENTNAPSDYEADLTSKDRAKQRLAVRRYLASKVKNNWSFSWPKSSSPLTQNSIDQRTVELLDADAHKNSQVQWKEREEWFSGTSMSGNDSSEEKTSNSSSNSDSSRKSSMLYRRKRRLKEELAKEMTWNDGLCCFTARRDAWTGAQITPKPKSLNLSPSSSETEVNQKVLKASEKKLMEEIVEIPIVPPLLPPENYFRSCITPRAYNTIYDKVIMNSVTPACPINLKHIIRSCVQGWKRDGQWPPSASGLVEGSLPSRNSIASLLTQNEPKESDQKDDKSKSDALEPQKTKDGKDENSSDHEEDGSTKKRGLSSCLGRILRRSS